MLMWRLPAAILLTSISAVLPASAQETRAEIIEKERAEKAKQLQTYEPGKIERAMIYYERNNPLAKFAPRNGFFIQYGYTGKPVGSGMAVGGGWRHDVLHRNGRIEFEAGQSLRKYRLLRADFSLPRLMDEKLELGIEGSHRYHPQEDFYGLGSDIVIR